MRPPNRDSHPQEIPLHPPETHLHPRLFFNGSIWVLVDAVIPLTDAIGFWRMRLFCYSTHFFLRMHFFRRMQMVSADAGFL
jgi:hypothetical protein